MCVTVHFCKDPVSLVWVSVTLDKESGVCVFPNATQVSDVANRVERAGDTGDRSDQLDVALYCRDKPAGV